MYSLGSRLLPRAPPMPGPGAAQPQRRGRAGPGRGVRPLAGLGKFPPLLPRGVRVLGRLAFRIGTSGVPSAGVQVNTTLLNCGMPSASDPRRAGGGTGAGSPCKMARRSGRGCRGRPFGPQCAAGGFATAGPPSPTAECGALACPPGPRWARHLHTRPPLTRSSASAGRGTPSSRASSRPVTEGEVATSNETRYSFMLSASIMAAPWQGYPTRASVAPGEARPGGVGRSSPFRGLATGPASLAVPGKGGRRARRIPPPLD